MSIRESPRGEHALLRAVFDTVNFVQQVLIEPIGQWRKRRATMHALSALDDRMLADIGVRRVEIEQLVRGRLPRRLESVASASVIRVASSRPAPLPEMKRAA